MRRVQKGIMITGLLILFMSIPGCMGKTAETTLIPEMEESSAAVKSTEGPVNELIEENKEERVMKLKIDGISVDVLWEDNESVEALKKMTENTPLTIKTSAYGGFEQVGPVGQSLPRNDHQTKTSAGDIVLYSGNQIVVFYGSNSWAYTRLGHIENKTTKELEEMLDKDSVNLTLY